MLDSICALLFGCLVNIWTSVLHGGCFMVLLNQTSTGWSWGCMTCHLVFKSRAFTTNVTVSSFLSCCLCTVCHLINEIRWENCECSWFVTAWFFLELKSVVLFFSTFGDDGLWTVCSFMELIYLRGSWCKMNSGRHGHHIHYVILLSR